MNTISNVVLLEQVSCFLDARETAGIIATGIREFPASDTARALVSTAIFGGPTSMTFYVVLVRPNGALNNKIRPDEVGAISWFADAQDNVVTASIIKIGGSADSVDVILDPEPDTLVDGLSGLISDAVNRTDGASMGLF